MEMKIIKSEKRICSCCMEEHEVKTVLVKEHATFKNRQVAYDALYTFCDVTEELYMHKSLWLILYFALIPHISEEVKRPSSLL